MCCFTFDLLQSDMNGAEVVIGSIDSLWYCNEDLDSYLAERFTFAKKFRKSGCGEKFISLMARDALPTA